jgi:thioredoxin-related protein
MIKIVSVLLLFNILVHADHIHWLGNYDKALEQAHKEHKNLIVYVVKNNCPSCNNIIKKYFMKQKYIEHLNKKFVSVIVTYEGKASYPIELFYTTKFPTLFFVNSETESFLYEPLYGNKINEQTISYALK